MSAEQETFRHGTTILSGIKQFKSKYKGKTAVIGCSGTTFSKYDSKLIPKKWKVVAVNEAIRKMQEADWWVCSDRQIIIEYAKLCPSTTEVLCMHEGTETIRRKCRQAAAIHTVESMRKPHNYNNGFEFFSRGTVLIGAVEMLRYMGFKRFFVFGCDCFRLKDQYYYDGRTPLPLSEKSFDSRIRDHHDLPTDIRIFVTPKLRLMIDKLNVAKKLWGEAEIEIYCVNSPYSRQTAMPLMSSQEFEEILRIDRHADEKKEKSAAEKKAREAEGQGLKEKVTSGSGRVPEQEASQSRGE